MVAMEVITALAVEVTAKPELAVQCAALHDCLEDTEVTYDTLLSAFGAEVAAGVLALTKNPSLAKDEAMPDSLARIRRQPREVWMVKLADRITNLQPPPAFWDVTKRKRYQIEAGEILDALGAASPFLARRLSTKIAAYAQFL
jgi:(p)ppGpp synthase/HD superfamily hydrolase